MTSTTIPTAFIWRRIHSLMGLWLVLFLLEHLLTNSQAALLLGENGAGFVRMVNTIHDLPYLPALEIFLIGTPIVVHGIWGIKYLMTSKSNSFKTDGSKPSLPEYGRNRAYTWQRITSWILLFAITAHVIKFRFIEYPASVNQGLDSYYFVKISSDKGLYTLEPRLGFKIYDEQPWPKKRISLLRPMMAILKIMINSKMTSGSLPPPIITMMNLLFKKIRKTARMRSGCLL
jgi:succinate dehydrogenase / fumarate reductase cytochrome b subunit